MFVSAWIHAVVFSDAPGFRVWLLRHTAQTLLMTWSHPPLLVLGSKGKSLFSACCGCRDSGYKSKNTNSDPLGTFLLSTAAQAVSFCRSVLAHKAAVCKWANTSPKSGRSEMLQNSSCSPLGVWALHCVWYHGKKCVINNLYGLLCICKGEKCAHGLCRWLSLSLRTQLRN